MLTEESRSKMLLKQQDPMMLEKKVNTTPVDYAVLNQLSQDFETRFVPQTELSAEQAFWSKNSVNSLEPTLSSRPTKVEVPKELPKVSMVNTSLKKLKYHLASFDVVVKERTTPIAITEGSWGFEGNERLLEQVISKDIVNTIVNSSVDIAYVNVHEYEKCLKLETELLDKKDFVENEIYDKLFKSFATLEKHCISLESQEKDAVIKKLKERIKSLSGKMNEDKIKKDLEEIETINIELDHRVLKLIAENEHLKQTYKQLYDSIKPAHFDELTTMASEHSSSGPALHEMTPATISSGLMPNPPPLTLSTSSTKLTKDAPSQVISQTTPKTQALVTPNDVKEDNHDFEIAHMGNDPYFSIPIPEIPSNQSSSLDSIDTIMHLDH
ncbi:hypothetical protein Tco_0047706 [Tanacetum coccineum]